MKPISDTGQAALVEYRTVRYEYALAHPFCEAQVVCGAPGWSRTANATEIHHILSLAQGGPRSDPDNLISVCSECHRWIHDHPESARLLGLMARATCL